MKFEYLEDCVLDWSEDRGIYQHSTAQAQMLKTVSEIGELADAIAKKNLPDIQDAVGDVLVCLINVCAFYDMSVARCLEAAWLQIKDRKGHMIEGGVFVKEGN